MFGKNIKDINTKKKIKIENNKFYNIQSINSTNDFSYFKLKLKSKVIICIDEINFYFFIANGSININNKKYDKSNHYFYCNNKAVIQNLKNAEIFILFQRKKNILNVLKVNSSKEFKYQRRTFKNQINKYWGEISTIFSNSKGACKIIDMLPNTQSSMEFHLNKKENYFINSGELLLGLRYGKAKQEIIKLKKNDSFFVNVGVMHMRISKIGTQIIEISNKDSDSDSNIVHNGLTYIFKTIK